MSDTAAKLVTMANQIATAFRTQAPDKAVAATADHLRHFWDPRMRSLILARLDAGGDGLTDIARRAVERLRAPPGPPVTPATDFRPAGGEAGSDAG